MKNGLGRVTVASSSGGVCTVFGGTGFLGRSIVRSMQDAGCTVRVAARRPQAQVAGAPGIGIERARADIREEQSVRMAVCDARVVVNAVSLYAEKPGVTFEEIHVEGAARVARAAREAGVESLMHISGLGADVGSPSKYVRARGRGEIAVREQFEAAVVLRPSVLFGRGDDFLASLSRLTRLPIVPLFGDGGVRLQPTYVEDVAAAAVAAALPRCAGRTYELGGADTLTYREIVRLVMARLGRRRPVVPLPFPVWLTLARICAALPTPPLTRDQVILMQRDNVVSGAEPGFAELGVVPRGFSSLLPQLLG